MIIKTAILNEMESMEFYKMAAEKAGDSEIKSAFLELSAEEELHMNWLKEIYKSLEQNAKENAEFSFKNYVNSNGKKSAGVLKLSNKVLASATITVAVYGIAINMEKAAVEFYQKLAAETSVPMLKELCENLSEWENGHIEQFSAVYDTMMNSWWDDQGFSPY
ncbi:MAG: ferritin family protein [Eubacteriales bacterium]